MDSSILSSPVLREHKPGDEWRAPERRAIRALRRSGKTYGQIRTLTGLSRSSIRDIIKTPSGEGTTRKGKATKKKLWKQSDLDEMKRVLQELWDQVDPKEWRYLTERLTCKIEDVIEAKGMSTVH